MPPNTKTPEGRRGETGRGAARAAGYVTEPLSADLLHGIRVVDFTQALSGPYCTLMLADLGADVIKVEHPGRGDDARHWGPPFIGQDSAYFVSVNRNKRSVALDLKTSTGRDAAMAIIRSGDVLVENWRPGVAARLALAPADLSPSTTGLIYCSISGYGQDQPDRASYDQIVQGTSGAMSMTGPPGQPTKWGIPIADLAAGMFASTAIVAALHERHVSGRGRVLDISMQDCLISLLTHQATRFLSTGVVSPDDDHNGHSTIVPYGLFTTSDGHVNICVGNDAQFRRLCDAMGWQDVGDDGSYRTNSGRLEHKAELLSTIRPRLSRHGTEDIVRILTAAGVPVGPVVSMEAALTDPLTQARGMVTVLGRQDFTGPAYTPSAPWKIDGGTPQRRQPPPTIGQHTEEVLAEVGFGFDEGL